MHSALLPGNQTLHVQPPAQWAPFQTTPPQQCASPLSIWCQARVAPHNLKTFAICGLWKPWKTYSSFILHSNATISIFNLGTPREMVLRSLHIVVLVPSFRKEERGVGTWLQKRWWSCKTSPIVERVWTSIKYVSDHLKRVPGFVMTCQSHGLSISQVLGQVTEDNDNNSHSTAVFACISEGNPCGKMSKRIAVATSCNGIETHVLLCNVQDLKLSRHGVPTDLATDDHCSAKRSSRVWPNGKNIYIIL